jgi:hypothetical protein
MNARHLHPPAGKSSAAAPCGPGDTTWSATPSELPGPACCCLAKTAVRITMPPTPARPHETDLLLCGHHYRVSRRAVAACGASVSELPATPSDVAAWIRAAV